MIQGGDLAQQLLQQDVLDSRLPYPHSTLPIKHESRVLWNTS
jgi:hypothetical protein